jgi:hypothetical protein
MKPFLRLPSPSMAVAIVALVTAMAGTSYAAVVITGKNVKNSSLTGADVKNSSLTSSDVKNRSLTALDFKANQLPRGATGATGAAGPQGARGPAGPTRWLLVNAAGQIEAQSGGFAVAAPYPETPAAANGNVYINAGEDLADNGINATLALQNQVNQEGGTANGTNTGGDGTPPAAGDNLEFSGEIAASRCGIAGVVACAPAGTNNGSHFVVSPRLSTGERTTPTSRKRFYVVISG